MSIARQDREKLANVPFLDNDDSASLTSSLKVTAPAPSSASTISRKQTVRRRVRNNDGAALTGSNSKSGSDDDSDNDSEQSEDSESNGADKDTVSNVNDIDDMNIFSPSLPPNRRIVGSKDRGGLALYRTEDGEWLSETELRRLANMARNARLWANLGLEEAKRHLISRPHDEGKDSEPEDDREFSVARTRVSLPPRERHPRASKQNDTQ